MSEMEKKNPTEEEKTNTAPASGQEEVKAAPSAEEKKTPAEEKKQEPAAEEASPKDTSKKAKKKEKKADTFTVTRQQMAEMEQLAKTVSEAKDKYLRLAAEYDNYRKRTAKEKEATYDNAKADTIKPFLDVYDNLVRGAEQCQTDDPHRQGLEMIAKQLLEVLGKLGVEEIPAQGQPFDPERHNAVMHVDDDSVGENIVTEVFQKGFIMGDKVIRFSMVKVAN